MLLLLLLLLLLLGRVLAEGRVRGLEGNMEPCLQVTQRRRWKDKWRKRQRREG
jgi:hypothetical protein